MTCIVGLVVDGRVWLGGDRAVVAQSHYLTRSGQPKVFRRGAFVIGYTSSFRMGQLLQYRLSVAPRAPEMPLEEYMATVFADAVRSCLKDGGYTRIESSREEVGTFLVGTEGTLFVFDDDYSVRSTPSGFAACGSGLTAALASLHTSANVDVGPHQRLLWALSAASEFVTSVCPPFDFLSDGDGGYPAEASPE